MTGLGYDEVVGAVMRQDIMSTTFLMRLTGLGYNRCAYLVACMEVDGIVGRIDLLNRREVLRRLC